jgi:hypothetical protein
LKHWRTFWLLIACALLPMVSVLHAQPREPEGGVSDAWREMYENRLSEEEQRGANPCPRPDRGFDMHPRRRGARIAICIGRVKSRVATEAWARGLDEYGGLLQPDASARKQAEMELWLRRLVGKFRIEGEYAVRDGSNPLRGTAECFAVGTGAGVSCAIDASWESPKERRKDKSLDQVLDAAAQKLVLHFGINPRDSRIRVTLLDYRAIRMEGFLVDDAVIFEVKSSPEVTLRSMFAAISGVPGILPLVTYTWSNTRVAVKPGGDVDVQLLVQPVDFVSSSGKEFDMKLRRMSRVNAGKSGQAERQVP